MAVFSLLGPHRDLMMVVESGRAAARHNVVTEGVVAIVIDSEGVAGWDLDVSNTWRCFGGSRPCSGLSAMTDGTAGLLVNMVAMSRFFDPLSRRRRVAELRAKTDASSNEKSRRVTVSHCR